MGSASASLGLLAFQEDPRASPGFWRMLSVIRKDWNDGVIASDGSSSQTISKSSIFPPIILVSDLLLSISAR